ncbi:MAG: diguanylate cyclase [Nitrospirae bacterium]|nr:MAG: diguanylate cyclase [Nitrospirota bacterium]
MHVRFWGTRGSIPTPGPSTAKYGGNTACVEVRTDDGTVIVLDCGTGARALGLHLQQSAPQPLRLHLFIGHTHWDHIQGFPFFTPAFLPEAELNIYAPVGFKRGVEEALAGQMQYSYFPVTLRDLRSRIHFTGLEEGFFRLGEVLVETQYLNHTAPTIAYRISSGGTTVAYVTDHEPFWTPSGTTFHHPGDQHHIAFMKGADLVIHDAQYSAGEYRTKVGWGHSTVEYATDVALAAGAKRLALFHHDPEHDDAAVERLESAARARVADRRASLDVFAAAEGLELDVRGRGAGPAVAGRSALRRRPITGGRVLIVSANQADLASIGQILTEENLVLFPTTDAGAALAQAAEFSPDLAIIDAQLPESEGTELIGLLRGRLGQPNLPVLLLTDTLDTESDPRIGNPATTDCLVKPFSPPMLVTRIRAWLSRAPAADRAQARVTTDPGAAAAREPERAPVATGGDKTSTATAVRYANLLAAMPLFRALDREQLLTLVARASAQDYLTGQVVVQQSEQAEHVFVVLSGQVRVVEAGPESPLGDRFLAELGHGEIVGEVGILTNQTRSATVVAAEQTRCLNLPRQDFLHALQSSAGFAVALSRVLAQRVYKTDGLLILYAPDPLTGLASQQAFYEQYRNLAAWARRRRTDVALLIMDVLHLKTINDHFGYAVGDETLRAVAAILRESTRATDLVARYGGDEFAVLLMDAGYQDVDRLIGRVRANLDKIGHRLGLPVTVQCRTGVAISRVPPESAAILLQEADQDMNKQKA